MQNSLCLLVTFLFAATSGVAVWPPRSPAAADGVTAVAEAASTFLQALTAEQRKLAQRPIADAERTQWHFVPGRYAGVELGALNEAQTAAAHALLRQMLSAAGHEKATAIVAMEDVLRALESQGGRDASHRDPGRYALLVCGEPAPKGTFMLRFQGHHLSLQLSASDGRLVGVTPRFLGSNPHELLAGARRGERIFGAEEDLARAFLLLLDEQQLAAAIIDKTAPPDVLLGPGVEPAALGARRGIAWKSLNEVQRGVLWRLIEEYAHVLHGEAAASELARVRSHDLYELSFAWAGGLQRRQGHYYRIHGTRFCIEYDNTQNDANHVHTVWRDFDNDFGGDVMRRHLQEQHGKK